VSSQALWYLTRGSGVVALLLLTATTLLGVLSADRWRSERWPRFAVAGLHRNLTLLALVFIGTHVGTTIADSYAPIGVKDVFVPFFSLYRPVWLGLGALALDLLLAITVTSLLRRHIGYRTWRALHWAAYGTWPLALAHGLGSGSDARFGWMAAISFGCLGLVLVAVTVRLVHSRSAGLQLAAGAVTFGLIVTLVTWYRSGPARHGWAARAGTPASILTAGKSSTSQLASSSTPVVEARPFSGQLVGRMSSSGPDSAGDAAVAIAAAVRGSEPGVVRLTLWGAAIEDGGIAMRESQVSYRDATTGVVSTGSIVGLDGNRVVADVASSAGSHLKLVLVLQIDAQAGSVGGSITATRLTESD
jgi:sulfoxide reductase heme-binding subunit YedZ